MLRRANKPPPPRCTIVRHGEYLRLNDAVRARYSDPSPLMHPYDLDQCTSFVTFLGGQITDAANGGARDLVATLNCAIYRDVSDPKRIRYVYRPAPPPHETEVNYNTVYIVVHCVDAVAVAQLSHCFVIVGGAVMTVGGGEVPRRFEPEMVLPARPRIRVRGGWRDPPRYPLTLTRGEHHIPSITRQLRTLLASFGAVREESAVDDVPLHTPAPAVVAPALPSFVAAVHAQAHAARRDTAALATPRAIGTAGSGSSTPAYQPSPTHSARSSDGAPMAIEPALTLPAALLPALTPTEAHNASLWLRRG
jgi:hypothetical protein